MAIIAAARATGNDPLHGGQAVSVALKPSDASRPLAAYGKPKTHGPRRKTAKPVSGSLLPFRPLLATRRISEIRRACNCSESYGIFWRKRRLRLSEGAAHKRGLEATKSPYGHTVESALVFVDCSGRSEWVDNAIRTAASDTQEDIVDLAKPNDDQACPRPPRLETE